MRNSSFKLDEVNWDFPDSNKSNGIHSIHPYPAKFISEIPKTLIDILGVPEGTWILDPFCGSGATLVEAQLAGVPSIGIDLNPIACLISKVKTQPLSDDFSQYAEEVVKIAQNSNTTVEIPNIPNLNHWFNTHVQTEITRLISAINKIQDEIIVDALRLALSSILVRVSRQDSDTRYAAVEKNINTGDVIQYFIAACERIGSAKKIYLPTTWQAEVIQKNIVEVEKRDISKPIGLVITSPPYPNAYEYWLYHKYRMFWLGYDPLKVKEAEIGARAHYFKKNHHTVDDFKTQMKYIMGLLYEVTIDAGHACIVIGRSIIHGNTIDNAEIITQIAQLIGFERVAKIERRIASSRKSFNLAHANIKCEHILIFKK